MIIALALSLGHRSLQEAEKVTAEDEREHLLHHFVFLLFLLLLLLLLTLILFPEGESPPPAL